MTEGSHEETLAVVSGMIREVVDDSWQIEGEITMDSSFSRDLELESIEFVALAEKLQERYGHEVDFMVWLSSKELPELIELEVGELVEYIDSCR
ncbi:MAG: phosphopantetheine-binding protein [Gemmatimonadota bacterium]|nr:phosphopantetheine-binding protein [Gemmatimonadota bacterium]